MRNSSWYPFVLDPGEDEGYEDFPGVPSIDFIPFVEISPAPGLSQTGGTIFKRNNVLQLTSCKMTFMLDASLPARDIWFP